jgi:hypothetical protein
MDGSQTVAKVMPRTQSIFVGVRESLAPSTWFAGPLKEVHIQDVRFWGVDVPVDIADVETVSKLTDGMTWKGQG